MRKISKNKISRKNKKSKKNIKNNIKNYSRKNNNMIGGEHKWNNTCGICLVDFRWTDDKWIKKFGNKPEGFNSVEDNGSKKNSNKNETAEPLVISKISELPCGHIVHTSCINDMLQHNMKNCPSCTKEFNIEEVSPVGGYDKDYFIELFKSTDTFDLSNFLKKLFHINTVYENTVYKNRFPKHFEYKKFEKSIYEYDDIIESISEALINIKNDNEENFKIKKMNISKLSTSLDTKKLTKLVLGLSNILKQNFASFKVFNFQYNFNLKLQHVILLAKGLEENNTLNVLDISHNNINDKSALFLGKALQTNKALVNLDITYNHIGKEGAEALVSDIEINKTLTRFHMDGSSIGIDAANNFLTVIKNKNKIYEKSGNTTQKLKMYLFFLKPFDKKDEKDIEEILKLLNKNKCIIGIAIDGM